MLAPWKKSYDQPRQHIKKQRHYFANKGPSSQTLIFPVVITGFDSGSIKKAERRRIDAFELWCWRRLLRVPWTARSNQSILMKPVLNIHWKDWCWRWNSNTLAIWWEELISWKRPSCWKRLKAEGEGNDRGWDGRMASLTLWTWVWARSTSWWWTGRPSVLQSMGSQRVERDWTELNVAPTTTSHDTFVHWFAYCLSPSNICKVHKQGLFLYAAVSSGTHSVPGTY